MTRERFNKVVAEALDALPAKFRERIRNVAVLVEDCPSPRADETTTGSEDLLMGVFEGVSAAEKSVWDNPPGPDRIVLYQKNIEAACGTEAEIRDEIRLTVLHELGHYFGLSEEELKDV